jgi:hypothetical protein
MESSYCYFAPKSLATQGDISDTSSNESTREKSSNSEKVNSADQLVIDKKTSVSSSISSSSEASMSMQDDIIENTKMEDETTIEDVISLKKNLLNEEEFSHVNHSEPIHIFLKVKPLSVQELAKQKDEVTFSFI